MVSAGNGEDGMTRLEKEQPALVMVDYMMPIMNGAGSELEVAAFLSKPFQLGELLETVERLIGQP